MKRFITIILSVFLAISVFTTNVFADTIAITTDGKLSESGWDQETHNSITVNEGISLTVDCFAVLDSLDIGDNATVTIVPGNEAPNGFMINENGSLTVGTSASIVATHEDEKNDGLLDLKGVAVSGLDLWRPNDPEDEKITDNLINGGFSYNTEVGRWYKGEDFGPTDEFPYVIHYHCNEGGSVQITSLTISDDNKQVDGENTTVRLPNTVSNVVFTYTPDADNRLDAIWIEQDGDDDTSRFVNLETDTRHNTTNKTFTLDLTQTKYNDPENASFKSVNMDFSFISEGGGFGPTTECPYVISYQYEGNGSVAITDPSFIDSVDTFEDAGNNTTSVRVANTQNTIEFTYTPDNGYVLDGIWIEQGDESINLETDSRIDKDNKTFALDISGNEYNDPDVTGAKFIFVKFTFIEDPSASYELFFPNGAQINGNVVSLTAKDMGGNDRKINVTVAGASIDSTNRKVLIPKDDLSSVTFTVDYSDFGINWQRYVRNVDLTVSKGQERISLPLTNKVTSLATIPSDVELSDTMNLEFVYHDFPWYTISFGNSGNIQTEHGTVVAERIHCGENTFTNITEEVNEASKIYPMSKLTGGNSDVDSPSYDPENDTLAKYKLAYGSGDIMVELGTEGVSIDYKFIPDYGYQVTDIVLNEHDSILNEFDPDATEISEFTFETKRNSNVHFLVKFSKTNDKIDTSGAASVNSASIVNGRNAATSGNLSLTVDDTTKDSSITNSVSTFNVTLDNVVSKGGDNGDWTNNITTFTEPITVKLMLDKGDYDESDYDVVRDHNGTKETLAASYNPNTGELSFDTNKFSSYTVIRKSTYNITEKPSTSININKNEDVLFVSDADFSKFVCVKVDGNIIESSYYDKASGSTEITLKAPFLNSLSNGTHTIEIVSNDGSAKTTFTITGHPEPAGGSSSGHIIPNTGVY